MGTSQSSSGAPSGVPLIPPWVPDPELPDDSQDQNPVTDQDQEARADGTTHRLVPPSSLAPAGRFGPARQSFSRYARSGASDELSRGLGHYIHKGLGGGSSAVRRFEGTVRTANSLYGALAVTSTGQAITPGASFDPAILVGFSAQQIIDTIIEAVQPVDGKQDSEASRKAIHTALSDLLVHFPDANLLNLSEDERSFVVQDYVALDVFNRFYLDIGKSLQNKAPSTSAAQGRLYEIRDYIKQTVAAAFRKLQATGQRLSVGRVGQVVRNALKETFDVFEEYVK